jgi:hypothetical protein
VRPQMGQAEAFGELPEQDDGLQEAVRARITEAQPGGPDRLRRPGC